MSVLDAIKKILSSQAARHAAGAAAGTGAAALENRYIFGDAVPEEFKRTNLVLGGLTGLAAGHPSRRISWPAIASFPIKETGILAGGGLFSQAKAQQQLAETQGQLTDTQLAAAKQNLTAARAQQSAAEKLRSAAGRLAEPRYKELADSAQAVLDSVRKYTPHALVGAGVGIPAIYLLRQLFKKRRPRAASPRPPSTRITLRQPGDYRILLDDDEPGGQNGTPKAADAVPLTTEKSAARRVWPPSARDEWVPELDQMERGRNNLWEQYRLLRSVAGLPSELMPEELAAVEQGQRQWIPRTFLSGSTPIPQMMASPGRMAALAGPLFGLAGGAAGLGLTRGNPRAAAGAAGLSGLLAALLAYKGQQKQNKELLKFMRLSPPGATKQDFMRELLYGAPIRPVSRGILENDELLMSDENRARAMRRLEELQRQYAEQNVRPKTADAAPLTTGTPLNHPLLEQLVRGRLGEELVNMPLFGETEFGGDDLDLIEMILEAEEQTGRPIQDRPEWWTERNGNLNLTLGELAAAIGPMPKNWLVRRKKADSENKNRLGSTGNPNDPLGDKSRARVARFFNQAHAQRRLAELQRQSAEQSVRPKVAERANTMADTNALTPFCRGFLRYCGKLGLAPDRTAQLIEKSAALSPAARDEWMSLVNLLSSCAQGGRPKTADAGDDDDDATHRAAPASQADRERAALKSRDLLGGGVGNALADYLTGSYAWGATRAGRATQMARAVGEVPGMSVHYPATSDILGTTGGMLGGGILGGVAGGVVGGRHSEYGVPVGGLAGMLLGGLSSILLLRYLRRKRYEDLRKKFDAAAAAGALENPKPAFNDLISALTPFGGGHRAGQADVFEALRDDAAPRTSVGRNIGYAGQLLPTLLPPPIFGPVLPHAGIPIALVQGLQQGINARRRVDRSERPKTADDTPSLSVQHYAPVTGRRGELTPEELAAIERGQQRWLPRIFQSYATPVPEMMASPGRQAALVGALAAAAGGGLGGVLSKGNPWVTAGSAGASGLLAALLTYYARRAENEGLVEIMRNLPPGANKREYMRDPAVQADLNRAAMMMGGGGRGSGAWPAFANMSQS